MEVKSPMVPLILPVEGKQAQFVQTRLEQPQQPPNPLQWHLEWNWEPDGPIRFEVWHTTNYSTCDKYAVGTNVPKGFTLWTNVGFSPVPLSMEQAQDFFIVRAVNDIGFSDWNQ